MPLAVRDNLLARLAKDWEGSSATADTFVTECSHVVSLRAYRGTFKATGKSVTAPFAHAWTVRNGLIGSFAMYTGTAEILAALA